MVAALMTCLLAGCGDDTDDDPTPEGSAWPVSSDPVDPGGLVWATGSTVHLADGTTIDTGDSLGPYVVAGDGVFFTTDVEASGTPRESGPNPSRLFLAEPDGTVTDTGFDVATLAASPDGRYLGVLDLTSGERDDFGTRQAEVVVVDLTSGEEVVRSTEGMGDPESDDLAALYPEIVLGVARLTEDTAYVEGVGEAWAYDLVTGEGEPLPDEEQDWERLPGDPVSPDGQWRFSGEGLGAELVPDDGRPVVPDPGTARWFLVYWADDTTAVGYAVSGPDAPRVRPGDRLDLMSCVVPTGACDVVEDTAGETIRFPAGAVDATAITLQDGSA